MGLRAMSLLAQGDDVAARRLFAEHRANYLDLPADASPATRLRMLCEQSGWLLEVGGQRELFETVWLEALFLRHDVGVRQFNAITSKIRERRRRRQAR